MILKKIVNLQQSDKSEIVSFLQGSLKRDYATIELDHSENEKSFKRFKAHLIYSGTVKSVQGSEFYEALFHYGSNSPFVNVQDIPFPVSIRYMSDECIVFERPPFKTSVRMSMKRARLSQHKEAFSLCDIWIPWTVWVVHFNEQDKLTNPDIKLYFNDKPIQNLDDVLSPAFTPNLFIDNRVCWGQTIQLWQKYKNEKNNKVSIAEFFSYFINDYFSGGWNLDLHNGNLLKLCNFNISMFRKNPFKDPVLMDRASKNKVKLKDTKTIKTEGSQLKNIFLNWSLLELDEVINAVSLFKETFLSSHDSNKKDYILSNIINLDFKESRFYSLHSDSSFEDKIVENLFKKSYVKNEILTNVLRWKITIKTDDSFASFWSDVFNTYDVTRKVFNESITRPDNYYFDNIISSYLEYYFLLNKESFVNLFKKEIDTIFLHSYLNHSSTDSGLNPDINLTIDIKDISNDFEKCFALWTLDPNNRFSFVEKKDSNLVETV